MKKLILCLMMLLVVPLNCYAHNAIGYMPERTTACIKAVENYFKNTYGLTLKENLTVYVTPTKEEYYNVLKRSNYPNALYLSDTTHAVTSDGGNILINGEKISDRHFYFVLAHEMVHKYQQENYPDPHADYVMAEGKADLIASDITMYTVDARDHGIPYESLKTREGFLKEKLIRNNDVLEQVRFYAQQKEGFLPK